MEDFGRAIKDAVNQAKESGNKEQALKELKSFLTNFIEEAYDKLDRLSPDVPKGKPMDLLDGAQTDIIHISEGLDDVFTFLLSVTDIEKDNRIDDAAGRLAGLTRSIDQEEIRSILDSAGSNGRLH